MICNLNTFREQLGKVMPAVGGQNIALTILEGTSDIVISAVKGSFAIFTTVHDVQDAVPMNMEVNANIVKSALGFFSGDNLYLEKKDATIFMHTDNGPHYSRIEVPFANMGAIATIADKSDEKYIKEINVKFLAKYITATSHALEMRNNTLGGGDARQSSYFVETDEKNIRVTTTDGHRISIRQGKIGDVQYSYIIPGYEMKAAVALLDNTVTIRIPEQGDYVQLVGEDIVIVMPVLSGAYFNTSNIISNIENNKVLTVTVEREELITACEMSSLVDKKVIFAVSGNKLTISTSSQVGNIEKTLDIEKEPDGKNIRLGFSAKYLSDALKSLTCKRVDIIIGSGNGVCEFLPHLEDGEKPKSGRAVEVVLPIRI